MKTKKIMKPSLKIVEISGGINLDILSISYIDRIFNEFWNPNSILMFVLSPSTSVTEKLKTLVDMILDDTKAYNNDARNIVANVIDGYTKSSMYAKLCELKDSEFKSEYDSLCDGIWKTVISFLNIKNRKSLYRDDVKTRILPLGQVLYEKIFYSYVKYFLSSSCFVLNAEDLITKRKDKSVDVLETRNKLVKSIIAFRETKILILASLKFSDEFGSTRVMDGNIDGFVSVCISTLLDSGDLVIYKEKFDEIEMSELTNESSYQKAKTHIRMSGSTIISNDIFDFIEEVRMGKKHKIPMIEIREFKSNNTVFKISY